MTDPRMLYPWSDGSRRREDPTHGQYTHAIQWAVEALRPPNIGVRAALSRTIADLEVAPGSSLVVPPAPREAWEREQVGKLGRLDRHAARMERLRDRAPRYTTPIRRILTGALVLGVGGKLFVPGFPVPWAWVLAPLWAPVAVAVLAIAANAGATAVLIHAERAELGRGRA